MRIGIDFDNTIICYDKVFVAAAIARGLLAKGFRGNKQSVRDAVLLRSDGELDWQRLQGHVYGKGIGGAYAFPGVGSFLQRAREAGAHVSIVSHKTEYGQFDPDRVNLRTAAVTWMEAQGFVANNDFVIGRTDIHFVPTRAEKLARIGALRCGVFVDDLEEVLTNPDFPAGVMRILLSDRADQDDLDYRVCRSRHCIEQTVFG
jgi:hypothetical protein